MAGIDDLTKLAEDLERHLGDPHDPHSAVPFARILELDEAERYPHDLLDVLHRWGAHEYGVPVSAGGRAVDIQDSLNLVRLVARRDATLATALSITNLAYMPIWVAGTPEQKRRYGTAVRNGAKLAWGLSERNHGSDVAANDLTATRVDGGYLVSGEKWLIGNATLADMVVLHARTAPRGGPAGFSILVLDKRTVPAARIQALPDEPLHGLRGIDMSGVRLTDCFVPDDAVIGRPGHGLEIALKSAHAIRVMITAISLGCADTALRLTLDFTTRREIFGRTVVDIAYSRRQLAACFADLMVADVLAGGAARSLQVVPGQSSVFSSAAKYLVPTMLQATVAELAVVLGARHYLRGHRRYAPFQKAMRDMPVANFADGNTVVNLKNIAVQLDGLLDTAAAASSPQRRVAVDRVRTMFDFDADLPPYQPWAAELSSRGVDDCVLALPDSVAALRAAAAGDPRIELLAVIGERFLGEVHDLLDTHRRLRREMGRAYGQSAELMRLAERYCVVHAAAGCLHHVVHASPVSAADPAVALLGLERLWQRVRPTETFTDAAVVDECAGRLLELYAQGRLFARRAFGLARPGQPADGPDDPDFDPTINRRTS